MKMYYQDKSITWNEWDGLWTEGNKMKHDQWSVDRRKLDETYTMNCRLKKMWWNINNEVNNVANRNHMQNYNAEKWLGTT